MKTLIALAFVAFSIPAMADDYAFTDNGASEENQIADEYQSQVQMDNMRQEQERQQQEIEEQERAMQQQQQDIQYVPTGESGYAN